MCCMPHTVCGTVFQLNIQTFIFLSILIRTIELMRNHGLLPSSELGGPARQWVSYTTAACSTSAAV